MALLLATWALTLLSLFWKASDPVNYLIKCAFLGLSMIGSFLCAHEFGMLK